MASLTPPPPICYLLSLPPETLLQILSHLSPKSLDSFSQTSSYSHQFAESPQLFKELFLRDFDPVGEGDDGYDYNYKENYKKRIEAGNWMSSLDGAVRLKKDPQEWGKVVKALLDIAITRAPLSPFNTEPSKSQLFLQLHLPGNRLSSLSPSQPTPSLRSTSTSSIYSEPDLQSYSHLQSLSTPTEQNVSSPRQRTAAREIVYRRDQWGRECGWGPYFPKLDGETGERVVDWRKVEALQLVTSTNLREAKLVSDWGGDYEFPRGWDSTRKVVGGAGKERDWAGVDGLKLVGTYCFLDYQSYQHFNFHRSRLYIPTLEDETEAVGECMTIELRLLPETTDDSDASDDDEDDDEDYLPKKPSTPTPPSPAKRSKKLSFEGRDPQRLVKGWVKMNSKNEVRWKWVISYRGMGAQTKWLLHGVQPGGYKSAFGIVGTWSTAEHDDAGPNGPFWYWPVQKEAL